ncbi:MAG: M20 family metallopeptidase, partial [Candidatus Binatia bacterium]
RRSGSRSSAIREAPLKVEGAVALVQAAARDNEVDRLLIEFLRSPSPQTEHQETDPGPRDFVADVVAPRIEALTGLRPELDGMGNLVWTLEGPSTSPAGGLLLMAYAMTYPAASMPDPFSGSIVSGETYGITGPCAWGRGACEQKGALAAVIGAAGILSRSGHSLGGPLFLVVSLAGETGHHGVARFILEHNRLEARHGIVGLGTNNRVCLGNKGRLDVEVIVRGKSCHSSTPWDGIDALEGARRVMDRLDGLQMEASHEQLGRPTLTATRIESGPAISHTVQDYCRLVLDRRLLPGEDPDKAFKEIDNALSGLEPWKVEAIRGAFMDPSEVPQGCPVATSLKTACERILEKQAEVFYSHAALDAGFLNRHGIESVMFGPGDLRFAHTDRELVSLSEVRAAARIYAAAALQLLA